MFWASIGLMKMIFRTVLGNTSPPAKSFTWSPVWQLLTTNFVWMNVWMFNMFPHTHHTEMSPWNIYNQHILTRSQTFLSLLCLTWFLIWSQCRKKMSNVVWIRSGSDFQRWQQNLRRFVKHSGSIDIFWLCSSNFFCWCWLRRLKLYLIVSYINIKVFKLDVHVTHVFICDSLSMNLVWDR